MQPTLIRVVDNIRKELEDSAWKGSYEQVETPLPGYHLCLTHKDQTLKVDLWDLCFQICFRNYAPSSDPLSEANPTNPQEVEIDTNLIDETGEVDWRQLDNKTKTLIQQIFANLPAH